jgi:hypothetical protein
MEKKVQEYFEDFKNNQTANTSAVWR